MPRYYIVEFSDGVQLVPSKWVNKSKMMCSWPNFTNTLKYDKAVKNMDPVNPKWPRYPILRIMGKADTYENGKNKLRKSEFRSDASSTENEETAVQYKRLMVDESSSDEATIKSTFPRLPSTLNANTYSASETSENLEENITAIYESDNIHEKQSSTIQDDSASNAFKQILIKKFASFKYQLDSIQGIQMLILEKLESWEKTSEALAQEELPNLPDFPIKNMEELKNLEDQLCDPRFKLSMIKELQNIGGNRASAMVTKQLQYMLHPEVAINFSYYGTTNKKAFTSLKLCDVIKEVTKKQFSDGCQIDEVIKSIQTFLRHAKEKIKRINEKANQC